MISGLAPGRVADTLIVGKSTCGKGAVGNCKNATMPAKATAAVSNVVAIGRRINGAEMPSVPIVLVLPLLLMPVQVRDRPRFLPPRATGRILRLVDRRRDK